MPAAKTRSECSALLRRYLEQYIRAAKRGNPRTSLRSLGRRLFGKDELCLARWSTEEAPANWRIPLHKLRFVAHKLGFSRHQYDELMSLRLKEIEAERDSDVAVMAEWVHEVLSRAKPEEDWLTQAVSRLREHYKDALPGGFHVDAMLRERLEPLIQRACRDVEEKELVPLALQEHKVLRANQSSPEDLRLRDHRVARMRERHELEKAAPRISRKVRSILRQIREESREMARKSLDGGTA
jgi:hypothetical protein